MSDRCYVVTSPETGETYRLRLDLDRDLTVDEERGAGLWMDQVAAAASDRMRQDLEGEAVPPNDGQV